MLNIEYVTKYIYNVYIILQFPDICISRIPKKNKNPVI